MTTMMMIENAEKLVLEQVKFLNFMLTEIRKRNQILREGLRDEKTGDIIVPGLGMSYAKLIGLGTPYEECIAALRGVKKEFDAYLKILRDKMIKELKIRSQEQKQRRKKRSFIEHKPQRPTTEDSPV